MSKNPAPEATTPTDPEPKKPILFKLEGKDYTAEEYPKAFAAYVEEQRKKNAAPVKP